jgi:predicted nuclease with TOPRIM domain
MTENTANQNQKNSRKGVIIAIIVILLIINGVQLFLRMRDNKQHEAEKTAVIQEKDQAMSSLDSLRSELQVRYDEIAKLGGDTTSLGEAIRSLNTELRNTRSRSRREINRIKQDYSLLLTQKDKEIAELREQAEILFNENRGLKNTIVEREDSILRLKSVRSELAEKVAVASTLKAENIDIAYIDDRGRERNDNDNEFKARRVDKIKVNFGIGENNVAKIETKEVMLRIVEPEGSTLHDVSTGSGTFEANGEEMYYTAKQSFLFDNKRPRLTFVYGKGSEFKKGVHTAELYAEGVKIGEQKFTIK